MCGIVGLIGKTENSAKVIADMTECIRHRGPDDDGFFITDQIALGMRRLSIIDLAHGKQPIFSSDKTKIIVFNGEIYNYKELKDKLISECSETFQTHTDTEVILKLYEQYGDACVNYLRGMFCFAIHNTKTNKTFVARDHFGIKPLYYLKHGSTIQAFGSEIKSLLLHPAYKKEFNADILSSYLRFQYNPHPETFFKHIFKLPPGSSMEIDREGTYTITTYFNATFSQTRTNDFEKTVGDVTKVMRDSVGHHMIADVEVGSFLSGGVDSSIIVSLMQELLHEKKTDQKVKTFTVGFHELSEGSAARETATLWNTDHHEIVLTKEEYFKALADVSWHFDEPVADPSAVALYFLAKEASKHVKVVLSGEGADEFFGGYNVYREPYTKQIMKWIPGFIKKGVLMPLVNSSFIFYGKNFIRRGLAGARGWYIGNAQVWQAHELHSILKNPTSPFSLESLYDDVATLPDSEKMQYIDIHTWLIGDILQKADKMSMAHSLEVRVPFLDTAVFNLAKTLAPHLKWGRGETKRVLREAFRNIVPSKTQKRKKLGFPIPLKEWLCQYPDVLGELRTSSFIDTHMHGTEVTRLVDEHLRGSKDHARKLYALLMLHTWHKTFFAS